MIVLIDRGPRDPKLPPDARAVTVALADGPPLQGASAAQASITVAESSPADPSAAALAAPDPTDRPPAPSPPQPATSATGDPVDAAQADAATAAATGVKEDCDIASTLQARLAEDVGVRAALARIPASARSVANAVMLWDGRWAAPSTMGADGGANPIRDVVMRSLALASSTCMRELVRGPRLIILDGPERATVLAFGSGVWRWADLLATA